MGAAAKAMLRLGEYLGGVRLPDRSANTDHPERLGIRPSRQCILAVTRFVPEKGLHDLVEAFTTREGDIQLVIAGDTDHETDYSRQLRNLAQRDARIGLTGYVMGEPLHQLVSHADLFVLPSYHEGLPIALLEAVRLSAAVQH